ncbi:MAG: heat-inducible transcriptional repressor HrcA [Holosporales bacterium]|jgi:heat-inducible transcriptional repressor|nr:heat-inducible transcriptional repressor HrcA [Holosporales bacterium]
MKDGHQLTERSLEIFRELVDAYIETGEAVGSRLLSKRSQYPLSSATIRNIMADLEDVGLLYAEHTSAGRIPTEAGLKFFVQGLLDTSDFNAIEDDAISRQLETRAKGGVDAVLEQATALLSEMSKYAGIVLSPRSNHILRQIEFMLLRQKQILVVMIAESGQVENRIIKYEQDISQEQLNNLSKYLSEYLCGKTLIEGQLLVEAELSNQKDRFSKIATDILQRGLSAAAEQKASSIMLRGQANLLEYIGEIDELDAVRHLFEAIETKKTMIDLLDSTSNADDIQVFIGAENKNFDMTGCSLIASPYKSSNNRIVGAIGVIGPTNMKYRQVIPLVNCISKVVNKLLGDEY